VQSDLHDKRRSARKRLVLVLLGGLNVVLILAMLSFQNALPTARAQAGGRAGGYVCVTAKPSGQAYDVLFVLDTASDKLHAFYPSQPPSKQMLRSEPRDLHKDFGN